MSGNDAGGTEAVGGAPDPSARWLEEWAPDLSGAARANAFLAAGLLLSAQSIAVQKATPEDVRDDFERMVRSYDGQAQGLARDRLRAWSWLEPRLIDNAGLDLLPAKFWAETWTEVQYARPGFLRVRLDLEVATDTDVRGITRLLTAADGVDAASMRLNRPLRSSWRFPLRLGNLPDSEGRDLDRRLREGFKGSSWQEELIRPLVLSGPSVSCDVLVVLGDPGDVPARLRALDEVRAGAVMIHSEHDRAPSGIPGRVFDEIADLTGAWAVGVVTGADPRKWIIDVVQNISHAVPLDRALRGWPDVSTVLAIDQTVMHGETIEQRAFRVVRSLRTAPREPPQRTLRYLSTPTLLPLRPPANGESLADRIEQIATISLFNSEHAGAVQLREAETHADDMFDEAAGERFILAAVTEKDSGATARSIQPSSSYDITVRIGPLVEGWLAAVEPFGDDLLDRDAPHELTVVFSEPTLLDRPQTGHIVLPVVGASSIATFSLETTADTVHIDARIIVLSGNRVLQTALIRVAVGQELGLEVAAEPELSIATPTASLEDRRTFGAAFVVNRNADGASRATSVVGDLAGQIRLDTVDVTKTMDRIAEFLTEVVDSPEDFAALASTDSVELLKKLAFHGRVLHQTLVNDAPGLDDVLKQGRRGLQIVAAKPDSFFPLEFAYAYPSPNPDAVLCAHAVDALRDPDPLKECTGEHTAKFVCPLGFCGLRYVIERHAYQPADSVPADWVVRSSPGRRDGAIRIGNALFAASSRVDKVQKGGTKVVRAAINQGSSARTQVIKWERWKKVVATTKPPSLLVLLAHTVHHAQYDAYGLEIGSNSVEIAFEQVTPAHGSAVVLLLGCETATAGAVSYERFPAQFRRDGAKVVVATLTEVLGRHAAPIAARFVAELYSQTADGDKGVGDALLATRRHLLADGMLAILAVVAFGDADWVVGT